MQKHQTIADSPPLRRLVFRRTARRCDPHSGAEAKSAWKDLVARWDDHLTIVELQHGPKRRARVFFW